MPPLPLRKGEIIPLAELPHDRVPEATRDQEIARLTLYNTIAVPTQKEITAMNKVHAEALEEDARRSLGSVGMHAA